MSESGKGLLELSPAAGCGCKLPWNQLSLLMKKIGPLVQDGGGDSLSGTSKKPLEDAAISKISADTFLVSSVDFGTPISDDPVVWGRVAAMNAISDIYAMGAAPQLGLSIVAWPPSLNLEMLTALTQSATTALAECSAVLAGGHTIESAIPIFGLSVTGLVKKNELMLMKNARAGQVLILTKPLGTGIITMALKLHIASAAAVHQSNRVMSSSNRRASELAILANISAATDVTGYGLIGHLLNMLSASGTSAELYQSQIPLIPEAMELISENGIVPNSAERNYLAVNDMVDWAGCPLAERIAMCDPQTSGGLLLAADQISARAFLERCGQSGQFASPIGRITKDRSPVVIFRQRDPTFEWW